MSELFRVCKECNKTLPISDYHLCRGKPRRVCKSCVSRKFKERYNNDKTFHNGIVQAAKEYHQAHKEDHVEQMHRRHAERYATDEEYRHSWNKRRKQRYHTDEDYRDKILSLNHNKRAASNATGIISAIEWQSMLQAFSNTCAYCGGTDRIEQDHVVPLSKGGINTISNVIPACAYCNRSKGAKDMISWYRSQKFFTNDRLTKIYEVTNQK